MNYIKTILISVFMLSAASMHAEERQVWGIAYADVDPIQMSWTYDLQTGWQLNAWFENYIVTYFFKKGPQSDVRLGLDSGNHPTKIKILNLSNSESIVIDKQIQYDQFDDGAKSWAGQYLGKFEHDGERFKALTVSVVQEVDETPDFARYILWKDI